MRVVINTVFLPSFYYEGYKKILQTSVGIIASAYPEHDFLFITTEESAPPVQKNIYYHFISPKEKNISFLKRKFWFDCRLPRILKRCEADILVSPFFCSFRIKLPQCLLLPLPAPVTFSERDPVLRSWGYKKYFPLFIHKAARVILPSVTARQMLCTKYPEAEQKSSVAFPAIPIVYQPVTFEVREKIKEKYTEGKEFFLFAGFIHPAYNLINLLKAFSLFKKRLQSNMKLVIVSLHAFMDHTLLKSIETYKYRNDIVLLTGLSESDYAALLASPYAFVYPVLTDGLCFPVLASVAAHVPVIAARSVLAEEIVGTAGLFADAEDPKDISDQLMRIYKDESLRNRFIQELSESNIRNNAAKNALQLWQFIQEATVLSS